MPNAGPPRAARGSISREAIVQVATRLVGERGFEQLTVRALAAEMGVAPMSLYRHVASKDDLLDEVVDGLLEVAWEPDVPQQQWRRYVLDAADRLRGFLVGQPAALHVYLRHPVTSPAALRRMDAVLEALRAGGCSPARAASAYATLQTYTIGFAALEAARAATPIDGQAPDLTRRLAAFTSPAQFRQGLGFVLDGVTRP